MKYFKDNSDNYFTFPSDGSRDEYITDDLIEITEGDYKSFMNPPELTSEQLLFIFSHQAEKAIQNHLDNKARELRYDNINSIAKYLGYENPFKVECEKLGLWCANCWVVAAQIETDVLDGTRTPPTIEEVIAELPVYA